MAFFQDPPRPAHGYDGDATLLEYVERALPPDVRAAIQPELRELGGLAATVLW